MTHGALDRLFRLITSGPKPVLLLISRGENGVSYESRPFPATSLSRVDLDEAASNALDAIEAAEKRRKETGR